MEILGIGLADLAPLAIGLVATGVVAGFMAGLLGIGGGIVIVPALVELYIIMGVDADVRMHSAIGTSLATIIGTSLSSIRSHAKRESVDFTLVRRWAPAIAIGALLGGVTARFAPAEFLKAFFAFSMFAIAMRLMFAPGQKPLRDTVPGGAGGYGISGGIGLFSSLLGIGGGTLSVPILTLCGVEVRRAIGTAAAFGMVIAIGGTLSFMVNGIGTPNLPPGSLGYVNLLGFLCIVPMTMLSAPWGAMVAHKLPGTMVKRLFAAFLLIVSARMSMQISGLF